MIVISSKEKCCGCTACVNICPKQCICLKPDDEGFSYPQVDVKECINCGMCEKICPMMHKKETDTYQREGFLFRTNDKYALENSTSGGFFSGLYTWAQSNNAVICAACYDKELNVKHSFISFEQNNDIDCDSFRGSKYVQSDLGRCFTEIKTMLTDSKKVIFVGTTCQVYGLKNFLLKEYDNLYTVDLVCHGVPSPKLWKKYIEYLQKREGSNLVKTNFRSKHFGYNNALMELRFSNGKILYESARINFMLRSFFSEIASRPSCYKCNFKSVNRISDLSIYDAWHSSALCKNVSDDNKGYTNVIVQSKKGRELLLSLYDYGEVYKINLFDAIKLDGIMIENFVHPHSKRDSFYNDIDQLNIDKLTKKYLNVTAIDYIIEYGKTNLYKFKLFRTLKRFWGR